MQPRFSTVGKSVSSGQGREGKERKGKRSKAARATTPKKRKFRFFGVAEKACTLIIILATAVTLLKI